MAEIGVDMAYTKRSTWKQELINLMLKVNMLIFQMFGLKLILVYLNQLIQLTMEMMTPNC